MFEEMSSTASIRSSQCSLVLLGCVLDICVSRVDEPIEYSLQAFDAPYGPARATAKHSQLEHTWADLYQQLESTKPSTTLTLHPLPSALQRELGASPNGWCTPRAWNSNNVHCNELRYSSTGDGRNRWTFQSCIGQGISIAGAGATASVAALHDAVQLVESVPNTTVRLLRAKRQLCRRREPLQSMSVPRCHAIAHRLRCMHDRMHNKRVPAEVRTHVLHVVPVACDQVSIVPSVGACGAWLRRGRMWVQCVRARTRAARQPHVTTPCHTTTTTTSEETGLVEMRKRDVCIVVMIRYGPVASLMHAGIVSGAHSCVKCAMLPYIPIMCLTMCGLYHINGTQLASLLIVVGAWRRAVYTTHGVHHRHCHSHNAASCLCCSTSLD